MKSSWDISRIILLNIDFSGTIAHKILFILVVVKALDYT